jgi:hypothetical protein
MNIEKEKSERGVGGSSGFKKELNLPLKPIVFNKAVAPKWMTFYHSGSGEMLDAGQYFWLVLGSQKNS